MADVYTRIGYIKGDTGATGAQGAKGDTGDAATIQVGSVTTVPYGQTANVINSGTEQAAVFDFTIPQGRPGQQTTEMDNLLLNSITTSAASFPIPAVGETGKVLWGKVTKWFSDMAALVASKFDAANVVNNLTTTASGYALDARQGKALNDVIVSRSTPVNVPITLANANVISQVAGTAIGIPLADSWILVSFSLGFTTSAQRGADSAIFKFVYNGQNLIIGSSRPYKFVYIKGSGAMKLTTYPASTPEFISIPEIWNANERIDITGVALMHS